MAEIVISEFMEADVVEKDFGDFSVHFDPSLADKSNELHVLLKDAYALVVRNRTQVTAELLDAAPNLRVIGRLGVGLDNIDLDACKKRGVVVCPATGANDQSVAEYVISAAFTLLSRLWFCTDSVLAGEWPRGTIMGGLELSGKCMGLIGLGAIAREVAVRARALGMRVIAYDPYLPDDHAVWEVVERKDFNDLLAETDVLSLHVPLVESTKNMIDVNALARMKDSAFLINAARGGIVDENALAEAMRAGRLAGAALDVFAEEPLSAKSAEKFAGVENLFLTPHIAGLSRESNMRVSKVTAENVVKNLR